MHSAILILSFGLDFLFIVWEYREVVMSPFEWLKDLK